MSRLADPTICPDCRAALDGAGSCTSCGLRLAGPLAAELWQLMLRADGLVERLRTDPAVPVPAASAAPGTVTAPAGIPRAPRTPARRRLTAASVPVVLLGLGGLSLLVSAVVFVAVAWSSLGIGARTAILLLVTGLLAAAAAAVTRRGLRGAAETLWVVVAGMLALDLAGARGAGMLGLDAISDRHAAGLVGLLLLAAGTGAAWWSASRPTGRLRAPQVVAGLGLLTVTVAEAFTAGHPVAATSVAVGLLAGLALLVSRPLPWTSYGAAALAALSWLGVVADGLHRVDDSTGGAAWWSNLHGWPLLVATGYAAALACAPVRDEQRDGRPTRALRRVAAAGALVCASVLVIGPLDRPTLDLVVGSAVVVALGSLARFRGTVWAGPAAVLAGAGCTALLVELVVRPWTTLVSLPVHGRTPLATPMPVDTDAAAPWTVLVVAAALLAAAWGAAATAPSPLRHRIRARLLPGIAPAAVGLAAGTLVVTAGAPLWVGAVAFTVALAAAALGVVLQQGEPEAELAAVVAAVLLAAPAWRLAMASHLLTALLCSAAAIALVAGHRWLRAGLLWSAGTTMLAALGVLSGALAVAAWSLFADASAANLALALAACAAGTGLAARFGARDAEARIAAELTALLVGLAGVALSPTAPAAATAATVVGGAICLLAALDRDRDRLGWLGAAVLGVATVLRVVGGVSAPELATLPAAALLLAAGAWRMHRDREVDSLTALGSGLTLALAPSLLLALDEPVSVRGVLVGGAAVAALAAGAVRRLSAPLLAGAVTTGVLAVRHLGPVAEALPRWISFGGLGLVLLGVGVTWESRRRELGAAARYLTALR